MIPQKDCLTVCEDWFLVARPLHASYLSFGIETENLAKPNWKLRFRKRPGHFLDSFRRSFYPNYHFCVAALSGVENAVFLSSTSRPVHRTEAIFGLLN